MKAFPPRSNMTKSSLGDGGHLAYHIDVGSRFPPVIEPDTAFTQRVQFMRNAIATSLFAAALVVTSAAPALAAPCKDAKGKFVKCPPKSAPALKKGPCKDAKGKFIKCK